MTARSTLAAPVAALVMALAIAVPARADFDAAMDDYRAGRREAAAVQFRELADTGHAESQLMLGYLYALGEGVPRDNVEAWKWLDLAAQRGESRAPRAREEVGAKMSDPERAEARRRSAAWRPNFLARSASAASPAPAPPASRATIAAIQRRLSNLGYDPGPADGVPGRRTRDAIRDYQRRNGLGVDGEPSDALLAHLGGARAPAAQSAAPASPAPGASGETRALVAELKEAMREAESQRWADWRFLDRLRALVQRYDWPWTVTVVDADFARAGAASAWTIDSGEFRTRTGDGLRTEVDARAAAETETQPRTTEEQAMQLLGALLSKQMGRDREPAPAPEPAEARIRLARPIANAFAIRVRLSSRRASGRLELGPYLGGGAQGYRLAYVPGAPRGLELVRAGANGRAIIEGHGAPLALEDGREHELLWTRDDQGAMAVALDGTELVRVADRGFTGAFDGFTLVNLGGEYTIHAIRIDAAE